MAELVVLTAVFGYATLRSQSPALGIPTFVLTVALAIITLLYIRHSFAPVERWIVQRAKVAERPIWCWTLYACAGLYNILVLAISISGFMTIFEAIVDASDG
jgi:hypothetical protein